jgi:hypothetical protein
MGRTTNRVRTEGARAFIPTDVYWEIPADNAAYLINVPIENYSDELNFYINNENIQVSIFGWGKRGVILEVTVGLTVPIGAYKLVVISPGELTNENLQGDLAGNETGRIIVTAGSFAVVGDDTLDIYRKVTPVTEEIGINTLLDDSHDYIVATADIELTLPASAHIGKTYTVHANGFTVTVKGNVGQTIIGHSEIHLHNYDAANIRLIQTNNWGLV